MRILTSKKEELEDQQVHINVGLQKIEETVQQVEDLQKTLSVKKVELQKNEELANQKLKQMVHDQQEAEG
eukprot:Pgem_evm1s14877